MKARVTLLVTHEGWFYFCPVWIWLDDLVPVPVPKYRLYWLFDLAVAFAQAMNWAISLISPASGGFVFTIRQLPDPREIRVGSIGCRASGN